MKELNYLKDHVKFKSPRPHKIETVSYNESQPQVEDEDELEFTITEEDLKDSIDDEEIKYVFEEIDEEVYVKTQNLDKSSDAIEEISVEHQVNNPENNSPKKPTVVQYYHIPEPLQTSQPSIIPTQSNSSLNSSIRDEDVIFGELVASQLMKITDESKKQSIKRSILNLFF